MNVTNPVKLPELLCPAGNQEKLHAALQFGADAVYLAGERFGLRASKTSFTDEQLAQAIQYTHSQGARAYVTLNILSHEEDLPYLPDYARRLASYGADAVIISDPGVLSIVRKVAPELEIHLSTQASTTNSASCTFWYEQGVKRIVLARELTLAEIAEIRRNIPADLELEAFVHGAMCMSYSGRCLLSNAFTGRDANRGECAQPCRWQWKLVHGDEPKSSQESDSTGKQGAAKSKPADELYLEEDERGSYFFNSRDLCLVNHVPELAKAGINSFKIEGRMKGAFYAATTAKVYREALDRYVLMGDSFTPDPSWQEELDLMVHRTYDTGFYFVKPSQEAKVEPNTSYHRVAAVCGRVVPFTTPAETALTAADAKFDGSGSADLLIRCEQRNKLSVGEEVDIIRPQGKNLHLTIRSLYDQHGEAIEATPHPTMIFYLNRADLAEGDREEPIPAGSFIRRLGDKDKSQA